MLKAFTRLVRNTKYTWARYVNILLTHDIYSLIILKAFTRLLRNTKYVKSLKCVWSNGDVEIFFPIITRIIDQIIPGVHCRWQTWSNALCLQTILGLIETKSYGLSYVTDYVSTLCNVAPPNRFLTAQPQRTQISAQRANQHAK